MQLLVAAEVGKVCGGVMQLLVEAVAVAVLRVAEARTNYHVVQDVPVAVAVADAVA